MLLETALVSVVCNVISQIISQRLTRSWQHYDKHAVEQITQAYLTTHGLTMQTSTIERQIYFIFRGMQWVEASGNLNPLPDTLPTRIKDIGKVYAIVSIASEKALDVCDWSNDDGTLIQQWEYGNGTNQHWRLIPVDASGKLFKIHSQHSSKVLDVRNWSKDNGALIQQWTYRGTVNQQWRLIPVKDTDDVFQIVSEYSKKALDVPNWSTENGTSIQQWDGYGDTNQQWRLMLVV